MTSLVGSSQLGDAHPGYPAKYPGKKNYLHIKF